MSVRPCVVGLGQDAAGDDGVGIAVLEALRRHPRCGKLELVQLSSPMDLISLLEHRGRIVLVDAVLASPAGVVVEIDPERLSESAARQTSSHGLGAAAAIRLVESLSPGGARRLKVVAVTIARPLGQRSGLSPEVSAAVPEAVHRVLSLLEVRDA